MFTMGETIRMYILGAIYLIVAIPISLAGLILLLPIFPKTKHPARVRGECILYAPATVSERLINNLSKFLV